MSHTPSPLLVFTLIYVFQKLFFPLVLNPGLSIIDLWTLPLNYTPSSKRFLILLLRRISCSQRGPCIAKDNSCLHLPRAWHYRFIPPCLALHLSAFLSCFAWDFIRRTELIRPVSMFPWHAHSPSPADISNSGLLFVWMATLKYVSSILW